MVCVRERNRLMTTLISATGRLRDVLREKENTVACRHTQHYLLCTHLSRKHMYVSPQDRKQRHLHCIVAAVQWKQTEWKFVKSSALRGLCYVKAFCCACVCRYLYQRCWSNSDNAEVGSCGRLREEELVWCGRDFWKKRHTAARDLDVPSARKWSITKLSLKWRIIWCCISKYLWLCVRVLLLCVCSQRDLCNWRRFNLRALRKISTFIGHHIQQIVPLLMF